MNGADGNLPRGWAEATLGQLGVWSGGGTPSKRNPAYWNDGEIPWVSPKDMGEMVLRGTEDHITRVAAEESSARVVAPDSIAFVVRSGILSRTLPIALVPFEAAYNQDMRVLTPTQSLNASWLLWALTAAAEDIRRRCQKQGTTVASIEVPQLQAYRLPVPPHEEQLRIVDVLARQFAAIERGLGRLGSAKEQLRPFHQSALVTGLTGALTGTGHERVSAEGLREAILERRRDRWAQARLSRYGEPIAPSPPPGIPLPHGWCWATVDELAVGVQYGTSAKTADEPGGVPVLRMGNIVEGRVALDELKYLPVEHEEFPSLYLQDGDLLFNRTNSPELVGKTAVARGLPEPCSFASYLIRVRFAPEVEPELVSWYINSPFGRAWIRENVSQQVGQANVNGSKLRALTVPLAPRETQARLRSEIDRLLSAGRAVEQTIRQAVADADRLKQSLLAEAVRGSLGTASSTDEPADRLLGRVRAEQAPLVALQRARRIKRRPVSVGNTS